MNIHNYLQVVFAIEKRLAEYFIKTAEYHKSEQEIYYGCQEMAAVSNDHIREIRKILEKSAGSAVSVSRMLNYSLIRDFERGNDLETDLRLLWLLAKESELYYSLLQHASGSSDNDIALLCSTCRQETSKQSSWLFSRIMYTVDNVSARS